MSKPWSQMNSDEKLEKLRSEIEHLLAVVQRHDNFNTQISSAMGHALADIAEIKTKLDELTADGRDQ